MSYDRWKLRSPDDERDERDGCQSCDEEDAEQERYEYEMQARIEAHDNEDVAAAETVARSAESPHWSGPNTGPEPHKVKLS